MSHETLKPEDLLGDPRLDREHQQMLDLVHAMAVSAPQPAVALAQDLQDLARRHFEAEEARMAEVGYYGAAAHRAEHRLLLERLQALRSLERIPDPAAAGDELGGTLLHHIREVDRLFARFLERRR